MVLKSGDQVRNYVPTLEGYQAAYLEVALNEGLEQALRFFGAV